MRRAINTVRSAGIRGLSLAPVAALLLSVAALLLGNGLLGTLLIVRAGQEGFSSGAISAMMSCYFAGCRCRMYSPQKCRTKIPQFEVSANSLRG